MFSFTLTGSHGIELINQGEKKHNFLIHLWIKPKITVAEHQNM